MKSKPLSLSKVLLLESNIPTSSAPITVRYDLIALQLGNLLKSSSLTLKPRNTPDAWAR